MQDAPAVGDVALEGISPDGSRRLVLSGQTTFLIDRGEGENRRYSVYG
jgi:hypothetical protein